MSRSVQLHAEAHTEFERGSDYVRLQRGRRSTGDQCPAACGNNPHCSRRASMKKRTSGTIVVDKR